MLFLHLLIFHLTFIIIFLRLAFCYIYFTDEKIKSQQWNNFLVVPTHLVKPGLNLQLFDLLSNMLPPSAYCQIWLFGAEIVGRQIFLTVKLTKLHSLSVLNYTVIWNTVGSHHCQILYLWICLIAKIYLGPQNQSSSHLHDHSQTCQSVSSVAQSCPTLCDPMDCSTPGLPVRHWLPEVTQTHAHGFSDAFQPSHPLLSLLLLPSIFPSIRVFSNESTLCIRWPKYWSFSFNISPSD